MVNYNVDDSTSWNVAASATLRSSDTVTITGDIEHSASFNTITLNGASVDGGGFVVTLTVNFKPMFKVLEGGTIANVYINGNDMIFFTSTARGALLESDTSTRLNYGTIDNCHIWGASSGQGAGILTCSYFGNGSTASTIQGCTLTDAVFFFDSGGGLTGNHTLNTTFTDCKVTDSQSVTSGRLLGSYCGASADDVTFNNCYSELAVVAGDASNECPSAFVGTSAGTVTFNRSIANLTVAATGASLVGGFLGRCTGASTITFNDCYVFGDFVTNRSPFIGDFASDATGTVDVNSSYHSGTVGEASVMGSVPDTGMTVTILDCVVGSSTYARSDQTNVTATNTSTDLATITGQLKTNWDNRVWSAVSGGLPVLLPLRASERWANTYTAFDVTPSLADEPPDAPVLTLASSEKTLVTGGESSTISVNNDGDEATFTIAPALPSGLVLGASTGQIRGAPVPVDIRGTDYTITARNKRGTATITLKIKLHDAFVTAAINASINESKVVELNGVVLPDSVGELVALNSGIADAADESTKRAQRRAMVNLLFARNAGKTAFTTRREDLGLPTTFTRATVLTYPAGQDIDMAGIGDRGIFVNIDGEDDAATLRNVGRNQDTLEFVANGDGTFVASVNGTATAELYVAGQSTIISGVEFTFGSLSTDGEVQEVPCFGKQTLIPTRRGKVPISALKLSDHVRLTSGHFAVPRFIHSSWTTDIVVFPPHAFGWNMPNHALVLTPNHLVRVGKHTVRAWQAVARSRGGFITHTRPTKVYHLGFDQWTWIDAHNVSCETLAWKPNHHKTRPYLLSYKRR